MRTAVADSWSQSRRLPGTKRVLVVDDEPDTVLTLIEILRDERYEAMGCASASTALQSMRSFDPDVVLSDISMPNVNGWDLARIVRANTGAARPVLIAISGRYRKPTDQLLATIAGYDHYLCKPCDTAVLLDLVAKAPPY